MNFRPFPSSADEETASNMDILAPANVVDEYDNS